MYHTPIKQNKCILIISILALLLLLCIACQDGIDLVKSDNGQKSPDSVDPFVQNDLLGRGINLGNMLEAPNEGDWGLTVEEEYFQLIKQPASIQYASPSAGRRTQHRQRHT